MPNEVCSGMTNNLPHPAKFSIQGRHETGYQLDGNANNLHHSQTNLAFKC